MDDPMADELRGYMTETDFDRSDALLDAAEDHLHNRRPDRAVAIWEQLISEGGKDADSAHVDYAEHLFWLGEDDEARTELAAVMAEGRVFSVPWLSAAEMLEERGDLADALFWYRAATACLTADELGIPNGPTWAREVRAGQRRLKWRMGIPLDDSDLLAEVGEDEWEDKEGELVDHLTEVAVIDGRLQFWARADFDRTSRIWGNRLTGESPDAYYHRVERVLRAHGDSRIIVASCDYYSWGCLLDVVYSARHMTELRTVASKYEEGRDIEWPPQRNQPCWCGSGTKYKRCCGANGATP